MGESEAASRLEKIRPLPFTIILLVAFVIRRALRPKHCHIDEAHSTHVLALK